MLCWTTPSAAFATPAKACPIACPFQGWHRNLDYVTLSTEGVLLHSPTVGKWLAACVHGAHSRHSLRRRAAASLLLQDELFTKRLQLLPGRAVAIGVPLLLLPPLLLLAGARARRLRLRAAVSAAVRGCGHVSAAVAVARARLRPGALASAVATATAAAAAAATAASALAALQAARRLTMERRGVLCRCDKLRLRRRH